MKTMNRLVAGLGCAALSVLVACSGTPTPAGLGGGGNSRGGGARATGVNPNTCGNYAATAAGRKLKRFLQATLMLERAVMASERYVKNACLDMARPLGLNPTGDTKQVCDATLAALKNHMRLGVKAGARLNVKYDPPRCEVNVDAAARVAAQCEARADAKVSVRCSGFCGGTCTGQCSGTCNGTCRGTCQGNQTGGQCNGMCRGTCEGSCSARCSGRCTANCRGHAEVDASASCRAEAEVRANVDAKCTKPRLDVNFDAGIVLDKRKLDAAIASIKAGIPNLLLVKAKVQGPISRAFATWSRSARQLAAAAGNLYNSLGAQAVCVGGQLAAAVAMITRINMSIQVQVSISVQAQGSVSAR